MKLKTNKNQVKIPKDINEDESEDEETDQK